SKDLRIWCGASSTGEEPYMIAMVLADFFGLARDQWDTKVLATDISTQALQTAVQGIYSADRLEKLPPHWKKAFLKPLPGKMQYQISDELRQEVIFRKLNLMDPFPFRRKMHTIFLRNVMIYFDEPTKRELVQKIYDALVPGGYLFIGTTETLDRVPGTFELVQPSIYRKKEGTI
ncbi:MAG: protein-glutamate O-methyltransferase CheR, partial [Lachnospiraceae bacterium]|nr:protein-glutamate O-methyltransferase CheR [Lachnospiraceae bacterium]